MSAAEQAPWDAWCDRRADARINRYMHDVHKEALVEFVCTYVDKHKTELRKEFAEQIAALRLDVSVQHAAQQRELKKLRLRGSVPTRKR